MTCSALKVFVSAQARLSVSEAAVRSLAEQLSTARRSQDGFSSRFVSVNSTCMLALLLSLLVAYGPVHSQCTRMTVVDGR